MYIRIPQEPGRSERLPEEIPVKGNRFNKIPGLWLVCPEVKGAKKRALQG
jgi:hypothetical protein